MLGLIRIEILKIFSRGRSYIGFAAIIAIVALIEIGIWIDGEQILKFVTQNLEDSFYLQGNLLNGYLISYVILNTLWIHIPLLVTIVTGDLIAGEISQGTFRMVLSRPVDRTKLLMAKFVAGLIYSTLLVIVLGFTSLAMGISFFGKGDLIIIASKISILPENDLIWRFLAAFAFGILSMAVVTALSFLFSVNANNSISPIISTMVVIIIFSVITSFQIPFFSHIRKALFTTYFNSWRLFFDFTVDYVKLLKSIIHLLVNTIVFFSITFIIFKNKEILS